MNEIPDAIAAAGVAFITGVVVVLLLAFGG